MPEKSSFSLGSAPAEVDPPAGHPKHRLLRFAIGTIGLLLLIGGGVFLLAGARFTQALQFENTPISFFEGVRLMGQGIFTNDTPLLGEEDGRINILLLGRAGERHPGRELTDTVMILSLDTRGYRVALISLPRDLLAPLPDTNVSVKINTLYQYGLRNNEGSHLVRTSVSTITGLPIHYFATIDFDGFEQVIDTLGGITVEVARDIYDTRYPGKNYSYETFELKKGWQKLDGPTALKYARERHNDPEGDFGRAKRQQQILQAVREKAWSLPTFLNPITMTQLLGRLGESVKTDITPEAAHRLLSLAEKFSTRDINTVVVDAWKKESLLRVTHVETGGVWAFALVPRSGTWQEIQTLAATVFDDTAFKERRARIEKEAATILIVTSRVNSSAVQSLAEDIRDTFPVAQVKTTVIPALENDRETAIIQSDDSSQKLFTLDSLIGRYALEKKDSLPIGSLPPRTEAADLIILYTRDYIPGLVHEVPPEDMGDFQDPESLFQD